MLAGREITVRGPYFSPNFTRPPRPLHSPSFVLRLFDGKPRPGSSPKATPKRSPNGPCGGQAPPCGLSFAIKNHEAEKLKNTFWTTLAISRLPNGLNLALGLPCFAKMHFGNFKPIIGWAA